MRLKGSVGQNGKNVEGDVLYVQYLLNDWRHENNRSLIAIDGVVGPATISAIRDFQSAQTHFVDGLVDTNKRSIHALEEFQRAKLKSATVDQKSKIDANRSYGGAPRPAGRTDFVEFYLNTLRGQ